MEIFCFYIFDHFQFDRLCALQCFTVVARRLGFVRETDLTVYVKSFNIYLCEYTKLTTLRRNRQEQAKKVIVF